MTAPAVTFSIDKQSKPDGNLTAALARLLISIDRGERQAAVDEETDGEGDSDVTQKGFQCDTTSKS